MYTVMFNLFSFPPSFYDGLLRAFALSQIPSVSIQKRPHATGRPVGPDSPQKCIVVVVKRRMPTIQFHSLLINTFFNARAHRRVFRSTPSRLPFRRRVRVECVSLHARARELRIDDNKRKEETEEETMRERFQKNIRVQVGQFPDNSTPLSGSNRHKLTIPGHVRRGVHDERNADHHVPERRGASLPHQRVVVVVRRDQELRPLRFVVRSAQCFFENASGGAHCC